ncbi:MAG: hypothetical protein RBG13Loki_3462 [Promethearchaeota archaeon CR_4]|nr:MAG: hypothetical protein RBG13Loki_3462 [Candidatus Lokiarchaeota archaeon CR_4]
MVSSNSERTQDLPTIRQRNGKRPLTQDEEHQKHIAYKIALFFGILILTFLFIIMSIYNFYDWVATLVFSLLWICPGYFANAGMFAAGRKGTRCVDGGRTCRDGRPIFGQGKTWRGLLLGPLMYGVPISLGIYLIFFLAHDPLFEFLTTAQSLSVYKFYTNIDRMAPYFWGCTTGYNIWLVGFPILMLRIFLVAYGAALGDLIAAFFKRRLNIGRGQPFWIVDQLDFQLGAVLFGCIPSLLWPAITPLHFWPVVVHMFLITAAIHIIANVTVYKVGLKAVPW